MIELNCVFCKMNPQHFHPYHICIYLNALLTHRCVYLPCRKANEGLLALSQEESMPISIRQLAYGTVRLLWTVCPCACLTFSSVLANRDSLE